MSPSHSHFAGASAADHAHALEQLSRLLGPDNVLTDAATRDRYGRTTGVRGTRPLAVVRPADTAQVQELVRIAGGAGLKLYPISRGRNWGYGDAGAWEDGQVIVDLGRMNRICELNAQLGYVVIEPGVTAQQLYDYLQQARCGLWMDATGAGPEASLVGNTLDRGFGHTPYGDHVLSCCGMEVVLADGRVLNTGFGHYQNAQAHRVYRYGVGPSLDGLFSQSNLGIVTRIGLWLMPEPEDFAAFFLFVPEDEGLERIIDRLEPLRLDGTLRSAIHIGNDLRVMSARLRYPFDRAGGTTPLPPELRRQLRRELRIGAWNASGSICGTRCGVADARRALRRALHPIRPLFVNDRRLALAGRLARWLGFCSFGRRLAEQVELVEPLYGLLKGIPTNEPLHGATWRVRDPRPRVAPDPLDAHAGLIWVSPVVPSTGRHAREVMGIIEPIYHRHGFDAPATFTMITERAMCCVTNISFDRRLPEEVEAAGRCYEELSDALYRAGYPPYRAGPMGMRKLRQGSEVFWDVVGAIKKALDPHNTISPGRYEPPAL